MAGKSFIECCPHYPSAEAEPEIDLAAVHAQLTDIDKRIAQAAETHNRHLRELGLPPL
ncbi:hypothetical protein [Desulfonatronum lacustre]|uniref:hypothetical protein n=1 Tax=Desulfonatronum lacustre TaxID=66849 RepID=UPI0004BBD2A9|nr:hypothetical protein [Desulfonatronum lacustre]